jgi:hypothetical protein
VRIRFKILLGCSLLTSVTVALGLFVLQAQRGLGDLAMNIYDDAVLSISYARNAETRFVDLRGKLAVVDALSDSRPVEVTERAAMLAVARGQTAPVSRETAAPEEAAAMAKAISQAEVDKAIAAIRDDLDVAVERAMSEDGRKAAQALRESVSAISTNWKGAAAVKQIDAVTGAFDLLVEQYTTDGLQLRVNAENLVSRGIRSTLIAIGASAAIALLRMAAWTSQSCCRSDAEATKRLHCLWLCRACRQRSARVSPVRRG